MTRDWHDLEGTWDRLRWARKTKFETAQDFVSSLGVPRVSPGTYRAYEREPGSSKHIPLDHQNAIRFGRKLGIRWEWLLLGEGAPYPTTAKERIDAAVDQVGPDAQEAIAAAVEALVNRLAG